MERTKWFFDNFEGHFCFFFWSCESAVTDKKARLQVEKDKLSASSLNRSESELLIGGLIRIARVLEVSVFQACSSIYLWATSFRCCYFREARRPMSSNDTQVAAQIVVDQLAKSRTGVAATLFCYVPVSDWTLRYFQRCDKLIWVQEEHRRCHLFEFCHIHFVSSRLI